MREKYRTTAKVETTGGIQTESGETIGLTINSIYCHLKLSFVKELPKVKAITLENYNSLHDRFRIEYM